jgi:hypothetical protein
MRKIPFYQMVIDVKKFSKYALSLSKQWYNLTCNFDSFYKIKTFRISFPVFN